MSDVMIMAIVGCAGITATSYLNNRTMKTMQATIDKLTDKLMSKDYSEYKRNNHITIDDSKTQRKPVSFYDDPSIEIDEDSVN